jgi:histidine triad (HIT) family protein
VSEAGCIFCQIVAGEIPAEVVFRDEGLLAFKDRNPQAPTHILVIPRRHVASVNELTDADAELAGRLVVAAGKVAGEQGLVEGGYRLVLNTGDDGGQTVHHIHLHVLGGRRMTWPPG